MLPLVSHMIIRTEACQVSSMRMNSIYQSRSNRQADRQAEKMGIPCLFFVYLMDWDRDGRDKGSALRLENARDGMQVNG